MKNLLLAFVAGLLIAFICLSSPVFASGGSPGGSSGGSPEEVELEIEIGPTFTDGDESRIRQCTTQTWSEFFPFDFLYQGNIPSSSECPRLEFWGYEQTYCWVLDIWYLVKPAFAAAFLIKVIISW